MKKLALMTCCLFLIPLPGWAEDEVPQEAQDSVVYVELKPAFVTNYEARKIGYLKADVTLKVKGQPTADAVDRHGPFIRHNLVMLFSRQNEEALNSSEGKLQLKQDALQEIVSALESEGEPSAVEDILFTSFIVD